MTIGLDTQTVFYQEEDFYTGQNVHILRIKNCTKYSYLFISVLLKTKIKLLYSWGGKGATLGRLKKESILLPVTKEGFIDFEFMDNFIKELPYSKFII